MAFTPIPKVAGGNALAPLQMGLQVSEQFARIFYSPADWNAIVRSGLEAGGQKWVAEYLPLRFQSYARVALGYRDKPHRGRTGHLPLVVSGNLRETALSKSWAEATATSSNVRLVLHIVTGMTPPNSKGVSIPYGNQPLVYRTLTSITEREVGAIALAMETRILGLIEGSDVSVSRKGTVRGSLTPTQRSSLGATKRPALTPTQRVA